MKEPLILAFIAYLLLVGLFYLTGAIALIIWKITKPIIIELSNKNIREKIIEQSLFHKQIKVLFGGN